MPTTTISIGAIITDNMALGDYVFPQNPATMQIPTKRRSANSVNTLDGMQFHSWGIYLAGRIVNLHWGYMPTSQFISIETLFNADAQVIWKPFTGTDYNVQILDLTGEFFIYLTTNASYRKNADLRLLIVSEA